jgi:hypothetical protein
MGNKICIYTTDKGRKYLVVLDSEIAKVSALDFSLASESETKDLDFLPRYMRMRGFSCSKKKGGVFAAGKELGSSSRVFAVGKVTANIIDNRGEFMYKGSSYVPRRFHPERKK